MRIDPCQFEEWRITAYRRCHNRQAITPWRGYLHTTTNFKLLPDDEPPMVDLTHPKCPKLSPRRDGPTDVAPLQVRAISSGTSVPLLGSACTPSPECGYAERTLVKLHPIRLFTPTQPHYANCTNIFDQHINLTTTTSVCFFGSVFEFLFGIFRIRLEIRPRSQSECSHSGRGT